MLSEGYALGDQFVSQNNEPQPRAERELWLISDYGSPFIYLFVRYLNAIEAISSTALPS